MFFGTRTHYRLIGEEDCNRSLLIYPPTPGKCERKSATAIRYKNLRSKADRL